MIKRISIIRHGKSSWENSSLKDIDRPLRGRGVQKTKVMGRYLADNRMIPDKILSSPAVRAIETAKIIARYLKVDEENIIVRPELYPGKAESITTLLSELPNDINYVMLFGHNPAFTDLGNLLLGEDEFDWLPTSGLIHLKFSSCLWADIVNAKAGLLDYVTPRQLMISRD
jgi:phosphohistidine phosphatase